MRLSGGGMNDGNRKRNPKQQDGHRKGNRKQRRMKEAREELKEAKEELKEATEKWEMETDPAKKAVLEENVVTARENIKLAREIVNFALQRLGAGYPNTQTIASIARGVARLEENQGRQAAGVARLEENQGRLENIILADVRSTRSRAEMGQASFALLEEVGARMTLHSVGDAILAAEAAQNLSALTDEDEVVDTMLQPLAALAQAASERSEMPLVLVDSQKHGWCKSQFSTNCLMPDMVLVPDGMYNKKTSAEQACPVGELAYWFLRDSIGPIIEWKVRVGNKDLGQGLEYCEYVASTRKGKSLDIGACMTTKLIMADGLGFEVFDCKQGQTQNSTRCGWSDPGSKELMIDAICSVMRRPRAVPFRNVCRELGVHCKPFPSKPGSTEETAFLGSGRRGRVFRVAKNREDNAEFALKIVFTRADCFSLEREVRAYESNRAVLEAAGAVASIVEHCELGSSEEPFAAALISPVGAPLPRTRRAIKAALDSLRTMARRGITHGDARSANVIWIDEESRALWIDFSAMKFHTAGSVTLFLSDIVAFVESMDVASDRMDLLKAAEDYYKEVEEPLLRMLRPPGGWR